MKTLIQTRFDAGIENDPRADGNVARMISNFDALTNAKKLTPYYDSENGDTGAATDQIQNFCVAPGVDTTYKLFGLGVVSGTGKAQVFVKSLTTGSSGDLSDSSWGSVINNASGSGVTSFAPFVYYQKTGLIYGARASTYIWAFDPSGNIAFADSSHALAYTNIAEGLVHSKDDILYIPYDNKIAKNNNGTWSDASLTLPSYLYITSICEYGNSIAIMCAPLNGVGRTRVFIWDRDATLATLEESIDWGDGIGKVLFQVDGVLLGISLAGNSSTRSKNKVIFRYYDGYLGKPFLTLEDEGTVTQLTSAKQLIDNRLWFMMGITKNGSYRAGTWSIGRTDTGWTLYHERTVNNDTSFTTSDVLKGFIKVGDYLFQSAVVSSSYALYKTNDQASYTATSAYETKVNPAGMPAGDLPKLKKLLGVAVMTEKLTGSAQVVLKVKVDGGSWSSAVVTHTTSTLNSQSKLDLIVAEVANPQIGDFRDIEFRLESTGGAVITGYAYAYNTYKSTVFE